MEKAIYILQVNIDSGHSAYGEWQSSIIANDPIVSYDRELLVEKLEAIKKQVSESYGDSIDSWEIIRIDPEDILK